MTALRKILAIAWKDTLVRFSSRSELLFFIVLPVVFIFILSGGPRGPKQDGRVVLPIADDAASPASRALIAAINQSATVRPIPANDKRILADGDAALLIIPASFEADLARGQATLDLRLKPNDLNAIAAQRAVATAAGQISRAAVAARISADDAARLKPFDSPESRQAWYDASLRDAQALLAAAPARLTVIQAIQNDSGYDPISHATAGQLITWALIPMIGVGALFAYERETGTLRRLRTTPTSRAILLLGVAGGQLATALVQMALLAGFGALALGMSWGRSPAGLALVGAAFGAAGVSLGVMLGTFVKTERQASGLGIMLGMLMALLGGCWYPLEIFPEGVRAAAHILPTTWAMEALTGLSRRGIGVAEILPAVGALFGFAALFFTVGVARMTRAGDDR
jgi:ABC-2 type transport system permease protein